MATAQQIVGAQKKFTKIIERMANPQDPRPLDPRHVNMVLQNLYEGRVWDELAAYRKIEGLVVIGPPEIEKAFLGLNGKNPLDLKPGWCPRIDVPWFPTQLKSLIELCKTPEWDTTPILWLSFPKILDAVPTNLTRQYYWWGVENNGKGPGLFRQDVMLANWFPGLDEAWVREPASREATWKISYEFPKWTTNKSWEEQKNAATRRGFTVSTPASDALMWNLVKIGTGKMLRHRQMTRTSASHKGQPISTYGQQQNNDYTRYYLAVSDTVAISAEYCSDQYGLAIEGLPSEISAR